MIRQDLSAYSLSERRRPFLVRPEGEMEEELEEVEEEVETSAGSVKTDKEEVVMFQGNSKMYFLIGFFSRWSI